MKFAIKKGWGPGVLAAVVAIVVYMPADPVTEILTVLETVLLTVMLLLVFCRIVPVAAWSAPRQTLFSWSVAATAAVVICLVPLIL